MKATKWAAWLTGSGALAALVWQLLDQAAPWPVRLAVAAAGVGMGVAAGALARLTRAQA